MGALADAVAAIAAEKLGVADPADTGVVNATAAAIAFLEDDTGWAQDEGELVATDDRLVRGLSLLAQRVYLDPATRSRTVDALGDTVDVGPVLPSRLYRSIESYWAHLDGNPDAEGRNTWDGRGFA